MKILAAVLMLQLSVTAYAAEYSKVQLGNSKITFLSTQMGVPVQGDFKKFGADVRLNPAKPESGSAKIAIELASIDAGSAEANDEVKGKNWFNVAEFPRAEFISGSVKALGGGNFEVLGKLTIKGKSMEVHSPFTIRENKGVLEIDGAFTLKRLDFGIGSGIWSDTSVVADEVQIGFHIVVK